MRRLGGAAAAAAVLLLLTGCGSQAAPPSAAPTVTVIGTPSTTPAPSPTGATPSRAGTAAAASAPADARRPAGQCPDSDLGVDVVPAQGGGGAGSRYFDVIITNTGGSTCVLHGTPGVSVVGGGDGSRLGEPAARLQAGARIVRLAAGQTAAAPLKVVNIRAGGGPIGAGCRVRKGDGYRVYPPHSKRAFLVRSADAYACTSASVFMTASPVARFTG